MSVNTATPAIEIRSLHVTYPARRRQPAREAVRGVDISIEPGQLVALLGPNGSGKSSLFRAICGVVPFNGEVRVHGDSGLNAIRRSLGVVMQSPSLDPNMTVCENLRDIAALHGVTRADAVSRLDEELARAELTEQRDTLVKRLSGGLTRRVDLVRALLHRPRVLLLDEPTVGLDPPSRKAFLTALHQRSEISDITILLSTHLTDEADQSDRVLFLHEGRLVADDPPAALRSALGERRVTVLSSTQPEVDGVLWMRTGEGWTAGLHENAERIAQLSKQLAEDGHAFTIAPPTLDDAFESLTGTALRDEANA